MRKRAVSRAVTFVTERLNGEDGLGAIYPAMANSVMMYEALGYPEDHPERAIARASIDKLVVPGDEESYCQPCVSPVWDTALVCHTLLEAGDARSVASVQRGLQWLLPRQELEVKGDWAIRRPNVRPGGWAFQYNNAHYPDLDDTAVVVMAMDRLRRLQPTKKYDTAIARGREWIEGMQSANGGYGAFDADNTHYSLNNIPFADHGALLDPPTEDVTGRCLSMLAQLGERREENPDVARAIDYLRETQLADGSWYGRWGMNYIYGAWSVLCSLNAAGLDGQDEMVRRAADWLLAIQNPDGGWGEDGTSYKLEYRGYEPAPQHGLADRLGPARPDGGRADRRSRGPARHRLPRADPGRGRLLERAALHGDRIPARVLLALSRLPPLLPAMGAGALPQHARHQQRRRRLRHVTGERGVWKLSK